MNEMKCEAWKFELHRKNHSLNFGVTWSLTTLILMGLHLTLFVLSEFRCKYKKSLRINTLREVNIYN